MPLKLMLETLYVISEKKPNIIEKFLIESLYLYVNLSIKK